MHILIPSTPATPWAKTIATLPHLHPLVKVDLPLFIDDFHPKRILFWKEAFIFVLTHFPCFSSNSPLSMVYELLQDCFVPNNSASGLISFLKYVSTFFMVMFFHQCHAYLLHRYYWLWKNELEVFDPSRLER